MAPNIKPLKAEDPKSFGGWKIQGRLGEGGYSTIYLGEKSGQLAALKMIRRELLSDTKVFERFSTEINNLERIDHPSISKIIESDFSTDVPYIAVEYIEGETLEQRVLRSGPLGESEWIECLSKIAAALDHCHKLAITHKDVSPGNIILSEEGPKLIDFGISYHEGDARVTQADETVGTPLYMSPEHYEVHPREEMDLFSLGATFTFAGSGNHAFSGNSKHEIRHAILSSKPNFEGLSKRQVDLMTPLLYKDFRDRPSLSQLIKATNQLREYPDFSVFEKYLKDSEEKLIQLPFNSNETSKYSKYAISASILGVVISAIVFYFVSIVGKSPSSNVNQSKATVQESSVSPVLTEVKNVKSPDPKKSQTKSTKSVQSEKANSSLKNCESLFKTNKLEEAIIQCKKEAATGSTMSEYYLGVSYRLSKETDLAKRTFESCSQKYNLNCLTELAYFQSRAGQTSLARANWKKAFAGGVAEAGRALGVSFQLDGEYAEGLSWFEKATNVGDKDAPIYAVELLQYKVKDLDRALNYAKKYDAAGISGMKERIGAIYISQKKLEDAKLILLPCANEEKIPCMSMLALVYYEEKDAPNAKKWASKSAAKGQIAAINLMARISIFLEFDLTGGKEWYQKSAAKGDLQGMHGLGSSYALVEDNLEMACFWWGQVTRRGLAQQADGTDGEDAQKWIDASQEQYDKRDCKSR
jgi:serine/threonine protein kinase